MFAVYFDICDVVLEHSGDVDLVNAVLAYVLVACVVVHMCLAVEQVDKWRVIKLQRSGNGYKEGD